MRDQEDDELNHTPLDDDNNQIMFDEEQSVKINFDIVKYLHH